MGTDRELKYKIIEVHERYYLAINEKNGYKECFDKISYQPDKNGYITVKIKEIEPRPPLDPEKVNKSFVWDFSKKEGENVHR